MSTKPLFENLADLLPHREPMILLDGVRSWGESHLEAVVEHAEPGLFTDAEGKVPAWVGIEYMVQAIGAWVGIQARARGETIRIGFLLGTREYTAYTPAFEAGEKVLVRVEKRMLDEDNLALFDCSISTDRLLASAQVKAIQPRNIEVILKESSVKKISSKENCLS